MNDECRMQNEEGGCAVRAILLDIEGTVAPISFVHDVLFPYAREHLEAYLRLHWDEAAVAAARELILREAEVTSRAQDPVEQLKSAVLGLMDGDVKATGLKQLQGLIWDEGYRRGAFRSPVYPDVPPAIKRWVAAGKTVAIYSSGSVAAQRVFFQHTTAGDLTPLLWGYFDTTSGPKRSPASYTAIAAQLDIPAARVLFISDIPAETTAAVAAGMQAMIAVRPGNAPVEATHAIRRISSFDELR